MSAHGRPSQTLRRLERILTMVPWLIEHPGTLLDDVADRFATSTDQVLEDLDLLGYCGLPGYGGGDLIEVSVFGDAVHVHMAPYFERPLRLSLREAVTLLLAARSLAASPQLPASPALTRATTALEELLGADAGGAARIAVDLGAPGDEHLPRLREAVEARRVVGLVYRTASGHTSEREVEPWALTAATGAWYLQGRCRAADGPRDFRVDRIRSLEVTDERAPQGPTVVDAPTYRPGPDDQVVELDVSASARWRLDAAVVDEVAPAAHDRLRVTLRTDDLGWAARLVLGLGVDVRVRSPRALADRVAALATDALARYGDL